MDSIIWQPLRERLKDYKEYKNKGDRSGDIWLKYDLNQLLLDLEILESMIDTLEFKENDDE